ncbi:SMP-30/gluconolactonase/LRE family protein [Nakamurella endophytica]|uniref:Calcium-binding protein n=1 Tax=Nakamurella endophytica TaxID=1748367 RepID=A0A917WFX0_9ACTN|nr:SMP-30/gluconolactonase/LRE family protein [Nakamurella endophytica]GGL99509.1 calcium-binding protein [Nakamurella endophytica]
MSGVRTLRPEVAHRVGAELGEGPVWDARRGELLFVDILAGRLHRAGAEGVATLLELDQNLGAALPAADGSVLLVTRSGFRVLDRDSGTTGTLLDVLGDRRDLRFNDAKVDPAGRCLAGTLSLVDAERDCALLVLSDGPRVDTVVPDVGLSNGLGWSPDGRRLYYADTKSGAVAAYLYDPDTGRVGDAAPFAPDLGSPDGLCVDGTGAVWVALWDGSQVRRFTPDGRLDTVLELPVPHVTSCAFGDDDGQTLYITTARSGLSAADLARTPQAGDVFAVRPGVGAPPAVPWRPVAVGVDGTEGR